MSDEITESAKAAQEVAKTTTSSRMLDAAVILTVASAILYVFGWKYWTTYFNYFGIDNQFITLSFSQ